MPQAKCALAAFQLWPLRSGSCGGICWGAGCTPSCCS